MKGRVKYKRSMIYYIIIPVVILILIALSGFFIWMNLPKPIEYEIYRKTSSSYSTPSTNDEIDLTNYREFQIYFRQMGIYETVESELIFDEDVMYDDVIISKPISSLRSGMTIKKGMRLGLDLNYDSIYSKINGAVLSIDPYDDSQYLVRCYNAESWYINAYVHQSLFIEYQINDNQVFEYLLPNGDANELKIIDIGTSLTQGYYTVKLVPKALNLTLLQGTKIEVQFRIGTDDCLTYVSIDALDGLEYASAISFYYYSNGKFISGHASVGNIYRNLIAVYIYDIGALMVSKIYVRVSNNT